MLLKSTKNAKVQPRESFSVHGTFKNISREPIGLQYKIGTDEVEWGRLNIQIILRLSFEVIYVFILAKNINHAFYPICATAILPEQYNKHITIPGLNIPQ